MKKELLLFSAMLQNCNNIIESKDSFPVS